MSNPPSEPWPGDTPPHVLSAEDVVKALRTTEGGLSESEAAARHATYGPNRLREAPPTPWWRKLLAQFQELVVVILIVAALVAFAMQEFVDGGAILAIVLLNGLLGYFQEERAEQALADLKKLSSPMAKVRRDGTICAVEAGQLVPGDVVELEAGDRVPADSRLIEAFELRAQESALTGESAPVDKRAGETLAAETALGDRSNMVYLGTVVSAGKALAIVTATGMATELGRIAGMLEEDEAEQTPLQRRLAELGRILVFLCLGIVSLVFVLELFRGGDIVNAFLLAVGLGVAAVPEGLPAVVTVALALGLQRMVARNALIRRLSSVETLGSVTVICSDKTGTLTRNEMTVRRIVAGGRQYEVTGGGYAPQGEFHGFGGEDDPTPSPATIDPKTRPELLLALRVAGWCNHAAVHPKKDAPDQWEIVGDPTEAALLVAALKAGLRPEAERGKVLHELPFDSERKAMSVIVTEPSGPTMYTKGAPEQILDRCTHEFAGGRENPLSDSRRTEINAANAVLAAQALRVLALAYRRIDVAHVSGAKEEQLVFAGLAGMIDPPRNEVREAVFVCRAAGIRPVMITGDHPATAAAIARELGIADEDHETLSGQQLDKLSDDELTIKVERVAVYARVSAAHKLRVVRAWQRRGQVVAMTGDGVNDAPAVKAADIGIGMGITGTDVTKGASDMVLADDNFASIVAAVEEGRCIYDNIQKVLHFLLSCNFGEIVLILAAGLFGWRPPLVAIQLLWINLVTDGLPALALSFEQPEPGTMQRPPRPPDQSIISWKRGGVILFQGLLESSVVLTGFAWICLSNPNDQGHQRAQTVAFCTLVFSELARSLAARSVNYTLFQLGPFSNPYLLFAVVGSALLQMLVMSVPFLRDVFKIAALSFNDWVYIIVLSLIPVSVIEIAKYIGPWPLRASPDDY